MKSFLRLKLEKSVECSISSSVVEASSALASDIKANFIIATGELTIGANSTVRRCTVHPGVKVVIGDNCEVHSATFSCDTVIENGCKIFNSNFSCIDGGRQQPGESSSIVVKAGSVLLASSVEESVVDGVLDHANVCCIKMKGRGVLSRSSVDSAETGKNLLMVGSTIQMERLYCTESKSTCVIHIGEAATFCNAFLRKRRAVSGADGACWEFTIGTNSVFRDIRLDVSAKVCKFGNNLLAYGVSYTRGNGDNFGYPSDTTYIKIRNIRIGDNVILQRVSGSVYQYIDADSLVIGNGVTVALSGKLANCEKASLRATGRWLQL